MRKSPDWLHDEAALEKVRLLLPLRIGKSLNSAESSLLCDAFWIHAAYNALGAIGRGFIHQIHWEADRKPVTQYHVDMVERLATMLSAYRATVGPAIELEIT